MLPPASLVSATGHQRAARRSSVSSTSSHTQVTAHRIGGWHHHHHLPKHQSHHHVMAAAASNLELASTAAVMEGFPVELGGRFSAAEVRMLRETYYTRLSSVDTLHGVELLLRDISVVLPPSMLYDALHTVGNGPHPHDAGRLIHSITEAEFYALVALVSIARKEAPSSEQEERAQLVAIMMELDEAARRGEVEGTPVFTSAGATPQRPTTTTGSPDIDDAVVSVPAIESALRLFEITADVCAATGLTATTPSAGTSPLASQKGLPVRTPPQTLPVAALAARLTETEAVLEVRRQAEERAAMEQRRLQEERHVLLPTTGAFATYQHTKEKSQRRKAAKLNIDALVNGTSLNDRRMTRGASMMSRAESRRGTMRVRRGITGTASGAGAAAMADSPEDPAVPGGGDGGWSSANRSGAARLRGASKASLTADQAAVFSPEDDRASAKFRRSSPQAFTVEVAESDHNGESSDGGALAIEFGTVVEASMQVDRITSFELPAVRSQSRHEFHRKRSPRPWQTRPAVTPSPDADSHRKGRRELALTRGNGITKEELDAELKRRHLGQYKTSPAAHERTPNIKAAVVLPPLATRQLTSPDPDLRSSVGPAPSTDRDVISSRLASAKSFVRSVRSNVTSGVIDAQHLSSRREAIASLFSDASSPERRRVIDRWLCSEAVH